jgi:hypothetical protein
VTQHVARAGVLLFVAAAWTAGSMGVATSSVPSGPPSGNVKPTLDAVPPGKVAVVASSAPVDGRIAVIVQNGTTGRVRNVRVTALATRPDGGSVVKASTRSLLPSTLKPDAIALGALEFRASDVPADVTLSYKVSSVRAPSAKDPTALDVGSLVLSPPLVGDVAQTLDVTVTNPSSRALRGPLDVRVTCFGESARPAVAVDARSKKSKLGPGASAHITVKLHELCPTYLVAAKAQSVG